MVLRTVTTILTRLAWLALATLIALGGAGIVASMDHLPGTAARPELTWAGDRAAEPALDAATAELEQLDAEVETLGTSARLALAQVIAGSLDGLNATIADGTLQLAAVVRRTETLEAGIAAVPGVDDDASAFRLSDGMRHRYEALAETRGITGGLEGDWAGFTGRAVDAARLTALLAEHDTQTAAAAKEGSAARYAAALAALDRSDAIVAEARTLRDRLQPTTDVATLTTWLDRNADYDAALRALYQSLLDADGRVTAAVRRAFTAEQEARERLPGDTRGLVVIMAEVAQGGLNQAVISIEEARGELAAALEVQRSLVDAPALPG